MPVSIVSAQAANRSASSAAKDEKDISGRYWIGDPEPRLCFCRILPSRTVMVRVGGGWQELSEFLTQHYSHLSLPNGEMHSAMLSPSKGHSASSLAWLRSASGPAGSPAAKSGTVHGIAPAEHVCSQEYIAASLPSRHNAS
ncbi:hypothetical protein L1887_48463 [Cichorium endivia]|nr:hypothetical protein L1887_48463 [Cichorium endivia]